jgi:pyruvate dehydrogenase E2 component (dihydrolipoamide acetyltransferase)
MSDIVPVKMPKWGLSMQEGTLVSWWKSEGDTVAQGEDLVDIETAKITNVCEAPSAGTLRRVIAAPGDTLPVGALLGVVADPSVGDADIDAFVTDFQSRFVPGEDEEAAALVQSTVEVGGRTIRIGRAGAGEGDTVVLVHGFSGDMMNWMFNIEPLSARGPVVAIDLPGHGGSSKDVGDGSLASLAAAVAGAAAEAGVTSAHWIGHSLGAAVAARVAIDRPGLVKSLVMIAPAYMPGGELSETFLTGVVEGNRAKDLKPMLEMLVADPASVSKDMVDDMVKSKRLDGVEEALAAIRDRMVEGRDGAALQAGLSSIPKALVIASKADQIVGAPDPAALPAGFRVVFIDGAGHMPHLEKSGEVNALIAKHLG